MQELQAARNQAWRAKENHREAIMMAAAALEAKELVEEKVNPWPNASNLKHLRIAA